MASSHNDIFVVQRFNVFSRLAEGTATHVNYQVRGHSYNKAYYLAEGIHPTWSTLVKTTCNPTEEKHKRFAKEQETTRKDMERVFGVLQSLWAIVRHPART